MSREESLIQKLREDGREVRETKQPGFYNIYRKGRFVATLVCKDPLFFVIGKKCPEDKSVHLRYTLRQTEYGELKELPYTYVLDLLQRLRDKSDCIPREQLCYENICYCSFKDAEKFAKGGCLGKFITKEGYLFAYEDAVVYEIRRNYKRELLCSDVDMEAICQYVGEYLMPVYKGFLANCEGRDVFTVYVFESSTATEETLRKLEDDEGRGKRRRAQALLEPRAEFFQ